MILGPRTQGAASLLISPFINEDMTKEQSAQIRVIEKLITRPEGRRKGDARWLMCETCLEADQTGTLLLLEVKPDDDSPLDQTALESWYHRFGFKVVQMAPTVLMAREARYVGR